MTIAGDRVEQEITIEAPPEFVFSYFTDPDRHSSWLGTSVELDARAGGIYRVVVNDRSTVRGEFVEVSPFDRVIFTWGFEGDDNIPPGTSRVTITLTPEGGRTIVRLVHTGLPPPAMSLHDRGWLGYVAELKRAVESHSGTP